MKTLPRMAGVAVLTALTQRPIDAALRCNGTPGFFDRIAGYEFRKERVCACAVYVERIEAAVEAIVGRDRPVTIVRTQRVPMPAPLVRA